MEKGFPFSPWLGDQLDLSPIGVLVSLRRGCIPRGVRRPGGSGKIGGQQNSALDRFLSPGEQPPFLPTVRDDRRYRCPAGDRLRHGFRGGEADRALWLIQNVALGNGLMEHGTRQSTATGIFQGVQHITINGRIGIDRNGSGDPHRLHPGGPPVFGELHLVAAGVEVGIWVTRNQALNRGSAAWRTGQNERRIVRGILRQRVSPWSIYRKLHLGQGNLVRHGKTVSGIPTNCSGTHAQAIGGRGK